MALGKTNAVIIAGSTEQNKDKIVSLTMDFGFMKLSYPNGTKSTAGGMILPMENDFTIERTINYDMDYFPSLNYQSATLTLQPNVEGCTFSLSWKDLGSTQTSTESSVSVLQGTIVTYRISKSGYRTKSGTITLDKDTTLEITMEEAVISTINLSYPFDFSSAGIDTSHLIGSGMYQIDSTNQAITNVSVSDSSGSAYGYIELNSPEKQTITVSGYVSSEQNYDYGGIYVGTKIYRPTKDSIKSGSTDGNGSWLFAQSGTGNSNKEYTLEIDGDKTYYINFCYAKDGSGHTGLDKLLITKLTFKIIV